MQLAPVVLKGQRPINETLAEKKDGEVINIFEDLDKVDEIISDMVKQ